MKKYKCGKCGNVLNKDEVDNLYPDNWACPNCGRTDWHEIVARPKCDELCIRYMNKECITERDDELCNQTDMYREVGDVIDSLMERQG